MPTIGGGGGGEGGKRVASSVSWELIKVKNW